ncbi:MAG: hypothetical protein QXQ79_00905 [Candidatus Nanoarchaeia archaeon]
MANVIILLDRENLQYVGILDVDELLRHVRSWLSWRRFDIEEQRYTEKVKGVREYKVWWIATKFIDEYSAIRLKLEWEISNISDIETRIDKTKKIMQNGSVNLYLSAELITDRQDYWTSNVLFSFLRGFYDRYVYRSTIEKLKAETWNLGWGLFNEIKAFLQLYKQIKT